LLHLRVRTAADSVDQRRNTHDRRQNTRTSSRTAGEKISYGIGDNSASGAPRSSFWGITLTRLRPDFTFTRLIGVNAAGDAGDASPAIFGQPGTKCLISPPKFVKIVIKLPAERCNQRLWYKQDTQAFKERVIVLILHEL